MAEHDHEHEDVDPELRALLAELDYDDAGPPAGLRDRTLGAVRAQPEPGGATQRRRDAARARRMRRPTVIGTALGVAAAAVLALVLVVGGGESAPDRTLTLAGADGQVTVEIRGDTATFEGEGARLPANTAYEAWTVTGPSEQPTLTSAGTFRPQEDGTIDAELTLPEDTPADAALAITREDDDDPSPNLPPVLAPT